MTYLTEMAGEICIAICDFLSLSLCLPLSLSLSFFRQDGAGGKSPYTAHVSAPDCCGAKKLQCNPRLMLRFSQTSTLSLCLSLSFPFRPSLAETLNQTGTTLHDEQPQPILTASKERLYISL